MDFLRFAQDRLSLCGFGVRGEQVDLLGMTKNLDD
jgi:hypothetical protein